MPTIRRTRTMRATRAVQTARMTWPARTAQKTSCSSKRLAWTKAMAKQKRRQVDGVLVVDKPAGSSSNHVLQQVKRLYNAEKAGHTGSLDPLATGVLPLCLGEGTKVSQ